MHFPRPVASPVAAKLCQGLLAGAAAATRRDRCAPTPAHRHARPCPPLLPPPLPPALCLAEIRTSGTRRCGRRRGGLRFALPCPARVVRARPAEALSASSKPDLPLTGEGLQGQTHAREWTSVLELRLQQHSPLRVTLLLPRPAGLCMSHPGPSSALERGHRARDSGHAAAGVSPVSSPRPARPMEHGEVPAQVSGVAAPSWGAGRVLPTATDQPAGSARGFPVRRGHPALHHRGKLSPAAPGLPCPPGGPAGAVEPAGTAAGRPGNGVPAGDVPSAAQGLARDAGTKPPRRGDGYFAEERREDESSRRSPALGHLAGTK